MTNEQAMWLKRNQQYRAVSNTPARHIWTERGMLLPSGEFRRIYRGQRPIVVEGAFEVAILVPDPAFQ
jgi:hypothetical protein